MSTIPLLLPELAALASQSHLTIADLEQVDGRPQPDGSRLCCPKVAPAAWASLAAGASVALRIKGEAAVLAGIIAQNHLGRLLAPSLVLHHLTQPGLTQTFRRQQLRELRRLDLVPAPH